MHIVIIEGNNKETKQEEVKHNYEKQHLISVKLHKR